ncbi:response regulator transcription factor [Roseococcus sp.]|uniref:response regulator transcription factor n=1 Tax=Roseococcus sp. TaxID=2109646 RepID=UPI003BAA8B47
MARILVVEDEILTRFSLAHWLRDQSHEVMEAGTGDEAAGMLNSIPQIDLVITDIEMPGQVDGLGLARQVRDTRAGLPVILVSARDEGPEIARLAAAFFRKPYDLNRVSALVGRLVPARDGARPA